MRLWIAATAFTAVISVVAIVPRFTARFTETHRRQQMVGLTPRSPLPACPMGDDLDIFLERRAAKRSASLWVPVCREQPWTFGRVIVVQNNRTGFEACRSQLSMQPNAACALDEQLAFLSNARSARSVARVKITDSRGSPIIWVTSQPLAWGDALVVEHRWHLLLTLCALGSSGMLGMLGRHARSTYGTLHGMRDSGPLPPAWPEFCLLFVLPRYAESLPVDYRDEYEERLESHGPAHAAQWYQQNVYASMRELIWMRLRRLLPLPSRIVR
jgi:hypothetical protein